MGAQAAGLARTQTRGTQSLVMMQPRDIKVFEKKAIEEASLLGERAMYGWGAGKDRIEGPAWPLTKSLMRVYGNCSLDMEPVQDLADAWVFTARAVDHETGYSISRQFRQSKKWEVHGRHAEARKEDVRFQIGQSKALRNVALAFLPEWLVDKAFDAAKGNIRADIEKAVTTHGMEKVVARAIERAASIGCSEARLLAVMGRKARQAITVEDLIIILCGIKAVETKTDTLDDVFPASTGDSKPGNKLNDALGLNDAHEPGPDPTAPEDVPPADAGAK